jgi:predicted nucleotidyltransferase
MKQHIMTDHSRAFLYRIRAAIHDVEPSARVILYGSRARGDAQPDSDWDILVLLDGPVESHRTAAIRHRIFHLELETDIIVSAIVLSNEVWASPLSRAMPFHANVVREGVEL